MSEPSTSLNKIINARYPGLTNKGKLLAEFVLSNPDKAVFMTTRELAAAVGTSEATVIRFVRQLDYPSYPLFIKAVKNLIDTELTLIERNRMAMPVIQSEDAEFERIIWQDIENIKALTQQIDLDEVKKVKKLLKDAKSIHIIGSRLSYSPAFYMGWTLAKVRPHVEILKGSDRTTIDRLTLAGHKTAVVVIATSRYPNELIKIGKHAKRLKHKLVLLTDSTACPLVPFSDHALVSPLKAIPFLGSPASLISLINYLVHSLASDMGDALKSHQERLEQAYLENDILFNY
ncbi:MAG: MurR/RpiR family transcriptional regulator [Desulfobacteraceae bacterium]|nr:MAG: MurR/RpiR family transcriptional regulator [Desulfobacteraceae bacterium]